MHLLKLIERRFNLLRSHPQPTTSKNNLVLSQGDHCEIFPIHRDVNEQPRSRVQREEGEQRVVSGESQSEVDS